LSPHTAKDFVIVVKKPVEVPALADAIRTKKTTIYKLRKVCAVITEANSKDWIDLATECSTRVVEKAVAMSKPREAVSETMTYVSEDVLEFKLAVSERWSTLLKETKDLMSQKMKRAVSSEDALQELMRLYCEKENPVKKAERALLRTPRKARAANRRTRYRNARVEHEVNLRDQGQCTHKDAAGRRCETKRWLEKHHVIEFANGGDHSVGNLVTLCAAHHRNLHRTGSVT
jgi:hypothetical protein